MRYQPSEQTDFGNFVFLRNCICVELCLAIPGFHFGFLFNFSCGFIWYLHLVGFWSFKWRKCKLPVEFSMNKNGKFCSFLNLIINRVRSTSKFTTYVICANQHHSSNHIYFFELIINSWTGQTGQRDKTEYECMVP